MGTPEQDLEAYLDEQDVLSAKADEYEANEEEAIKVVVEGDEEFSDYSNDFFAEFADDEASWGEFKVFMRSVNANPSSPDLKSVAATRLFNYINEQAKGSDEVESVCNQLIEQGRE